MAKKSSFLCYLLVALCSVGLMGLCFTPALAEETVDESGATVDMAIETPTEILPDGEGEDLQEESFGVFSQGTWIAASQFDPMNSGMTWSRGPFGGGSFRCRTGGGTFWFDAPIRLPSGSRLQIARLFYYDPRNPERVWLWIGRTRVNHNNQPFSHSWIFGPIRSPAGTANYGDVGGTLNTTIANQLNIYQCRVRLETGTCVVGVRLFWNRQIGPQGGQIFWDVPPGRQFAREINNLARSGITTGFSDGSYRPAQPITRGAMAAFFARALGLYWDYFNGY